MREKKNARMSNICRCTCLMMAAVWLCDLLPSYAVPSGTEQAEALKSPYWNHSDKDWVDWVVVSVAPTRIYMPSWTDQRRMEFFEDFDPDFLDMWSGAAMNRGDFFRMRGVAVNSPMEYEYQEAINPVAHYAWELFGTNGIARKEDGSVAMRPFTPVFSTPCMCNLAPKWHETVQQGIIRPGVFGDAVFQDNIANAIYTWNHGFCGWCNRRFVEFMKGRFSPDELNRMGFNPAAFQITAYIKQKRGLSATGQKTGDIQLFQEQEVKRTADEKLLEDPILHEYIRFQHIANMSLVVQKADALKRTAAQLGRPIPAFYGNIPRISGLRAFPTIMCSQVDIAWAEESTDMQPPFYAGKQAWSTLLYKVGRAVGKFSRPVFAVQYHGGLHRPYGGDKRLPTALALAEAHANGGVPVQTWSATEFKYLMDKEGWDRNFYEVNSAHAQFAGKNRVLFTDRTAVARVALVHSLTSTFWRQFQSFTVPRDHLDQFTAAARFLEEKHVPYEILALGHPDIFDDEPGLARLDSYNSVIIPGADCVSDRQAQAISDWVRRGGNLVVWGNVGTRNEELAKRVTPVFADLIKAPGAGTVRVIDAETANQYAKGETVLSDSKENPQSWKYTFDAPASGWFGPDFDDSSWKNGNAPFGSKEIRGIKPSTTWATPEIYMRREFVLPDAAKLNDPLFEMVHWWDADVYINGVLAVHAEERGRIFEGYQAVEMLPQAKAALKPGKNIIAVHCRNSVKDTTSGQIVDVGILNFADIKIIADCMKLPAPLVETDLPASVWVNVWKHGAGPMTSVALVNYALDAKKDTVSPVEKFTVRLQVPDSSLIFRADWFAADYSSVAEPPAPRSLPVIKGQGWVEVQVPRLDLFGVVVFSAEQELAARTAAAEARKWFERIRIAQRCLDGSPVMDATREGQVQKQLAQIQGNARVENFSSLADEMQSLADSLRATREAVTERVTESMDKSRQEMLAAEGVYKFDFGTGQAAPGWLAVTPDTIYPGDRGYGWMVNTDIVAIDRQLPDALHGDFIRNVDPAKSDWPDKGKNKTYFPFANPPHRPGEFRLDIPNGTYRVTVISGDYSEMAAGGGTANEGRTAMTSVQANGKLKLIGDTLRSGHFDNRAFEVDVTEGRLDLRFFGSSVGPLYCNSIEWLVNGLLVQKLEQKPLAAALAAVEHNKFMEQTAIRNWLILGPFDDSGYEGMSREFGPEKNTDPAAIWKGKKGELSWKFWSQEAGEAPRVPLGDLCGVSSGSVAFAQAQIKCAVETAAVLDVSMSQYGLVYLNGETIYKDEYAVGLLSREGRIPIRLKAGMNTILIKSMHHWGDDWACWAGLSDPEGKPLNGVEDIQFKDAK
jgi:hypothetical protein